MPNSPLLQLDGVRKRFGPKVVLDGVQLAPVAGEAIGILGANGSGKSTLLRILAGAARPSSGTVSGSTRTAYVPDRFPSRQRMSAGLYLRHMGRIRGLSAREAGQRADEWLTRLSLEGGSRTPMRELSKGNAQKVGLAQALLSRPDLLVLDEPWSGLDTEAHGALAEITAELTTGGTAVIFTDHRPDVVRSFATRAYRLADGRLHPLEELDPVARIVLREPENGTGQDWSEHPGVRSVHSGQNAVDVVVSPDERESVLLTAIRRGWGVLSVSTDEPEGPAGGSSL